MLKNFFGADIYRVDLVSDMFFNLDSLSNLSGVKKLSIKKLLYELRYSRVTNLKRGKRGRPQVKVEAVYNLESLLGIIFNKKIQTEKRKKVIKWICATLNNLAYDEFVSLHGYMLDIHLRRAVSAYVCNVDKYKDIALKRYAEDDVHKNSMLRGGLQYDYDLLRNPDVYIDRIEVISIRAIDLSIYLLCKHCIDVTHEELLIMIGIDVSAGEFTQKDKNEIKSMIK